MKGPGRGESASAPSADPDSLTTAMPPPVGCSTCAAYYVPTLCSTACIATVLVHRNFGSFQQQRHIKVVAQ